MPRMCSFCRVRPARKNREHVLPDWLALLFPSDRAQVHWRRFQTLLGHREKIYEQRLFRAKTGCTCETCNSRWMSDMENETKGLLRPLALSPVSIMLNQQDQERLARWTFLRFLVLHRAHGDGGDVLPDEHYEYIFERRLPPPGVQIWIGRRPREGAWPYRYLSLAGEWRPGAPATFAPAAPESFNVYTAALLIGHLVMYLWTSLDGRGPVVNAPDSQRGWLELWPFTRSQVWPPGTSIGYANLEATFEMAGRYVDRAA